MPLHVNGVFTWEAGPAVSRSCEINSVTGNISNSDMNNLLENQQSQATSDGVVSYGFYDAGSGFGDVPYTSHHQSYVYYGDQHRADWMGNLVANHAGLGAKPFSTFVLPGGHDVGMNTSKNIAEVANNAKSLAAILTKFAEWIAEKYNIGLADVIALLGGFVESQIELIMINLGITQKDTITHMLDMGIRYFDFRPGYNAVIDGQKVASGDGLYHQHNFLPGMAFPDFLREVVSFLEDHPQEIVVVSLGFAGFYSDEMKPGAPVLKDAVNQALQGSSINSGNVDDAGTSYQDLINSNKRLLFFNNGAGVDDALKYDSYSDGAYQTLVPEPILGALNGMQTTPPTDPSYQYTVLQFQGTASGVSSLWPKLALYTNQASSPLLMTKGYFDSQTYAWAQGKLGQFDPDFPLALINDFVDPAFSQIAEEATLTRANLKDS